MDNYQRVEGEPDLAKDSNVPGVVINRNKSAYEKAKARSEESRRKLLKQFLLCINLFLIGKERFF